MFEVLEGQNIRLRKAKEDDYQSMLKHVWGDEAVYRWMLYQPTLTEEDALDRCRRSMDYQKEHYAYFVALKETNEAIGLCAIKESDPGHFEESGICIGTAFQGLGYGKEIVALLHIWERKISDTGISMTTKNHGSWLNISDSAMRKPMN